MTKRLRAPPHRAAALILQPRFYLLRGLGVYTPLDEPQRKIQPGSHAPRRDDVAIVNDARTNDFRAFTAQILDGTVVRSSRPVHKKAAGRDQHSAGAHSGHKGTRLMEPCDGLWYFASSDFRPCALRRAIVPVAAWDDQKIQPLFKRKPGMRSDVQPISRGNFFGATERHKLDLHVSAGCRGVLQDFKGSDSVQLIKAVKNNNLRFHINSASSAWS